MADSPAPHPIGSSLERDGRWLVVALALWALVAYLALPMLWKRHEKRHPALDNAPHVTLTGSLIPGDPLNLSIVGSQQDLVAAMTAAHWDLADSLNLRHSLHIIESTLLHRAYETAPVSNLFLFGRREDLAFEKPFGPDPSKRHHVRFWKAPTLDEQGRPLWFGAVTFDRSVGFSHTTGQITHHIAPDIDTERDALLSELQAAGKVDIVTWENDFQPQAEGHNGGGDPWHTDRRLPVITLKSAP